MKDMFLFRFCFRPLVVAAAAFFLCGCGVSPEVRRVNDREALMAICRDVDSVYLVLSQSFDSYNAGVMDSALAGFNSCLASVSSRVGSLEVSDGCRDLYAAVAEKVRVFSEIGAVDSREQVRIYKIPDSDFTDELRAEWDRISAAVRGKVSKANARVSAACDGVK